MRKVLISIGVFLLSVCMAHGQGVPVNGEVLKSTSGQAASVRVCTKEAVSNPCTILANICKDEALTICSAGGEMPNPIPTDAYGNYVYYAAPGTYKEQITANRVTRTRMVAVGSGGMTGAEIAPKSVAAKKSPYIDVTHPDFGASPDGKVSYTVSTTAGSAVITNSIDTWNSSDVGKTIWIREAGGTGIPHSSVISSYQNARQVTLSSPAVATVSSMFALWSVKDSTTAIQAAIDYAQTLCDFGSDKQQGRCPAIYFPAGNYSVTSTLNQKSARWFGAGQGNTVIFWNGETDGLMVENVGTSVANNSSIGGIEEMTFQKGASFPATHVKFDAIVDAEYALNRVSFYGCSGDCIDIDKGWVNLWWRNLRFDLVAGHSIRMVMTAVEGSAVFDGLTTDHGGSWLAYRGEVPPSNPKGTILVDNTPNNVYPVAKPVITVKNGQDENNNIAYADDAAFWTFKNLTAAGGNGVRVVARTEGLRITNIGGVGSKAPTLFNWIMNGLDGSNTALYISGVQVDPTGAQYGSRLWDDSKPGSSQYMYGYMPKLSQHLDDIWIDLGEGGRIRAGNTLLWDFVTMEATGKIFKSRSHSQMLGNADHPLYDLTVAGKHCWYGGSSDTEDFCLYRNSATELKVDQQFRASQFNGPVAIDGCAAGTYAKADGTGCGSPSGTLPSFHDPNCQAYNGIKCVSLTGQTAAIAATPLVAAPVTGQYCLKSNIYIQSVATAGTFQVGLHFNNGTQNYGGFGLGSTTSATSTSGLNTNVTCFHAAAGTAIQYSVIASGITGSPQYGLDLTLTREQ